MAVDESFKKPGAVPFKWEIRPGVPRIRTDHHHHRRHSSKHQHQSQEGEEAVCKESIQPPQKLKPPPSGFLFFPQEEPRGRSFRSAPRARSERWRVDLPMLGRPACVSPAGCFPTGPVLKGREKGRVAHRPRTNTEPEPDYLSDVSVPTGRSASSRKSVSPFRGSPSSSYFSFQSSPRLSISSFYRSSPQPAADADWASFGLF